MNPDSVLTHREAMEAEPSVFIEKIEANVFVRLEVGDFDLAVSDYNSFGDLLEERAHEELIAARVDGVSGIPDLNPNGVKVREYELAPTLPADVGGVIFQVKVEVTY